MSSAQAMQRLVRGRGFRQNDGSMVGFLAGHGERIPGGLDGANGAIG
jgi:hypothetical protein